MERRLCSSPPTAHCVSSICPTCVSWVRIADTRQLGSNRRHASAGLLGTQLGCKQAARFTNATRVLDSSDGPHRGMVLLWQPQSRLPYMAGANQHPLIWQVYTSIPYMAGARHHPVYGRCTSASLIWQVYTIILYMAGAHHHPFIWQVYTITPYMAGTHDHLVRCTTLGWGLR